MKDRQLLFALLITGMSLGTAWAVRGQFGHEQGAAWAGGIGALSIILLSKRADWYTKAFHLTLASAAGWGIGGIISYGVVVGYGRGTDFGNVYYGLLMLFVIGGLFGLLGGGLFGLMLSDTSEKPIKWHHLLVEMTAGAIIFYYLLIEEFGWLMTPPRSEAWAACFGMVVAMFWFMLRHQYNAAIRVAVFAGLGGGFGFAFGNFLQVIGNTLGIQFNFWNVMEYSIGFFGGVGMAYGTFTSDWNYELLLTPKKKMIAPITILALIIPFLVWDQSFDMERLLEIAKQVQPLEDNTGVTLRVKWLSFLFAIVFGGFTLFRFYYKKIFETIVYEHDEVNYFFYGYFGLFIIYSILITMSFLSFYRIEQYLYIANFVVVMVLINRFEPETTERGINLNRWLINLIFVLAFLAILTAIAVSSHGEMPGTQSRF